MKTRSALALMVVLALGASASADLDVVIEKTADWPAEGLAQYTLYLTTDAEDWATSFDGRFDGPMNQYWSSRTSTELMDDAEWLDEDFGPGTIDRDTHLLWYEDWLATARSPAEDGDRDGPHVGMWFASGTGAETMAIGIKGAYQSTNLPFIQIVHAYGAKGDPVVLTGSFGRNDETSGLSGQWIIPEPLTLTFLAMGGFGLLIRRRR